MTRASTRNKTTAPARAGVVAAPKTKAAARIPTVAETTKVAKKSGDGKENHHHHVDHMVKAPSRRISNEFDRTGDTLYMSAIDL